MIQTKHFTKEQIDVLSRGEMPYHVAIIMDGNRRWAKKRAARFMASSFLNVQDLTIGHSVGAENVLSIVEAAWEIGIKVLTIYGFSTENWKRSAEEVTTLLQLFENFLRKHQATMKHQGVRFQVIGDLSPFPIELQELIKEVIENTKDCTRIDLVLAINYGSRDEICRAIRLLYKEVQNGLLPLTEITPEKLNQYLDTAAWPDPDLLIRTSGEMRVSNFLLWQLAYTEIYVTEKFWPDFTSHEFFLAIQAFQQRERRIGL